ncbi:hypothetical protein [Streptomyces europaeiscabiei]|uniref:hypothetical protein n=1 Tax=Streptomyces europaeiscabiei TaxID=146819 RepID=UPI002E0EBC99|nr:hypothetical protein OHB30_00695 [Streptomyces europaeiscabiei]WSG28314.1 hypothetical protein OHB30_49635 [Streptomyces europaeiscabiei]
MTPRGARTALSHRICTGIPRRRLGKLIAELAGPWMAGQESQLRERRGRERQRAAGAGPDHELVFTDRVVATLVILRFQLPHAALALFYEVDRTRRVIGDGTGSGGGGEVNAGPLAAPWPRPWPRLGRGPGTPWPALGRPCRGWARRAPPARVARAASWPVPGTAN